MSEGFARPRAVSEVLEVLAQSAREGLKATLLAGGTDWMVERHLAPNPSRDADSTLRSQPPGGALVVDLSGVAALARVETEDGPDGRPWVRLGAGVTYRTLREHPVLAAKVPLLGAMAREVGAVQIQALGTLGGNIATGSPAADGVPALVALGARVRLCNVDGAREVPLEDYYTGYRTSVRAADELLESVSFPLPDPDARWFWRKVGTRRAQSIAKVALASVVELREQRVASARLAMASVAPTVACLHGVRAVLVGRRPQEVPEAEVLTALRADIAPIGDVRSTREYRVHVAQRLVLRMFEALGGCFLGTSR